MTISKQNLIKWALIFAGWTVVAFFYTTQVLIQNPYRAAPLVLWRVIVWELFCCYIWLAFTPAVLWLSWTFPLEHGQRLKNLLIYIFASIIFSLVHLIFYTAAVPILPSFIEAKMVEDFHFFTTYKTFVASYFHFCLISFWGIIAVDYLIKYYRAFQERALRASQLEASLAQSQLQVLKTQLQPHFLFNTLNTISELVHEDEEVADKLITRLSGLLRISLDTGKAQEVSLREELGFLQKYLDIERARFEERLNVHLEIQHEILDALLPNMILQPLVENAVRHSIAPRAVGGKITIRAARKDTKLFINIEDDGKNLPPDEAINFKEGIGLSNTRARLEALYGAVQRFELKSTSDGGLIVNIEIPFHTDRSKTEE